ncbi:enoyl-CoA hydratase/isomerase family protein [Microbacterium gorillae]|uniref:enoyl-CoA hydratase/isomerase family protein n=1 Tax=Microbacterium gorillae TaxID=1231063 RepID=UPI00058E1DCE|nr:enoyl-CoA hydratase/isomerase family protein [Microbacterium gorillae]
MTTEQQQEPSVLVHRQGGLGRLTLNRPRALNALDLDMVRALAATLRAWVDDPDVATVLIDGAGERGLCAGGDVRALRAALVEGRTEEAETFFREEYDLDLLIATYPKPVVVFADGVTMGGGIGLAGHAAIRIVTERSVLAMPETRIGFTPDVGGSLLLARAPGRLGEYLGLTGATMTGADAIEAGFADHFVPSERLSSLLDALQHRADPGTPSELVLLFDETPDAGPLHAEREWIDDAFARDTVAEIIARLREIGGAAAAAADTLEELSPSSLVVTLAAIRAARSNPDLSAVLEQEFHLGAFLGGRPDMPEGIRAQLVDKDRNPSWSPATIADVPADLGETALAFRGPRPLWE